MPLHAIWAVRYDIDRSRIVRVQVSAIEGERVQPAVELTRDEFLDLARLGGRFVGIRENAQGAGLKSTSVQLVRVGGEVYVRFDSNAWPLDELVGIPEY